MAEYKKGGMGTGEIGTLAYYCKIAVILFVCQSLIFHFMESYNFLNDIQILQHEF